MNSRKSARLQGDALIWMSFAKSVLLRVSMQKTLILKRKAEEVSGRAPLVVFLGGESEVLVSDLFFFFFFFF